MYCVTINSQPILLVTVAQWLACPLPTGRRWIGLGSNPVLYHLTKQYFAITDIVITRDHCIYIFSLSQQYRNKEYLFIYLDIYFRLLSIATSTSTTTVIHGLYTIH